MKINNYDFCLNILNITFCICPYIMIHVCYACFRVDETGMFSTYLALSAILIKFFILYIIFKFVKKYFPNFILSKVVENIKLDKIARKRALLLAIAYDLPIMFLLAFNATIHENLSDMFYIFKWDYLFDFIYFAFGYELLSVGGVLTFYLSTFCLWKIEDKIKEFYNKKLSKKETSK